ncbi:hypothetical protein Csa_016393 [Cucumis sativus]|nr:hypothetical protein Csa_016393 [Cucumis sativus]
MGKKASVFLVSLLLLIGLSKQDAFDYFQVVHEWQPAICNLGNSCKIQPKNEFGIHGVWPSVYSKGQIGPCCGPSFDPLKIISLQDRMNQYWKDLENGNSIEAWASKWEMHGTCSAAGFDQFKYFCLGLDTYGRHAIFSFLDREGLAPSSSKYVAKASFITAIANSTLKKGGVICAVDQYRRIQLQKAVLCYVKDGHTLIDCPDNVSSSCPDNFVWLALGD